MDIPLWVGLLLAFGDMAIAFYIGTRYGPDRARRLTIESLQKPEVAAQIKAAWDFPTLGAITGAMSREVTGSEQRMQGHVRGITDSIKALPKPDLQANITLPVTMQDAVQRDIRTVARQVMKEVVTSDMQEMLDAAVQKAIAKGGASLSPDAAKAEVERLLLEEEIDDFAAKYGIKPTYANVAKKAGRAGMALLKAYLPPEVQEAMER